MKIIIGNRYKIVSSTKPHSGHCFPVGEVVDISSESGGNPVTYTARSVVGDVDVLTNKRGGFRCNVYGYELEPIKTDAEYLKDSIEDITKEKVELDEKIKGIQSKLDWMEEVGVEEFDANQYKAYQTLMLLESNELSLIEKSKIIAGLING